MRWISYERIWAGGMFSSWYSNYSVSFPVLYLRALMFIIETQGQTASWGCGPREVLSTLLLAAADLPLPPVSQTTRCCPSLVLVLIIQPFPKPFQHTGLVERLVWSPGPEFFFTSFNSVITSVHRTALQRTPLPMFFSHWKKDKSSNKLLNQHLNTRTRKVKLKRFYSSRSSNRQGPN